VQLSAAPDAIHTFAGWSGDCAGQGNPCNLSMTGDKSATANFNLVCYSLGANVNPGGAGSVSANPSPNCVDGKYTYGSAVQLTYATSNGYIFNHCGMAVLLISMS
jgi:uncharacterized repeat protein (TIGR02543 family)